jgi:membrane-anchored glycerophosphoryl diester phosphodiesterase (GDPDase)
MDIEFYIVAVVFFTIVYLVFTLPRQILRRRRNRRNREAMAREVKRLFES